MTRTVLAVGRLDPLRTTLTTTQGTFAGYSAYRVFDTAEDALTVAQYAAEQQAWKDAR